jgi:hypothetical protein
MSHIVDGEFQSDKYPMCPRGKVPLSIKDITAQDLLWQYAQRRRAVDAEFADDLEMCLRQAGYSDRDVLREMTQRLLDRVGVFDIRKATERELLTVIRILCEAMISGGLGEDI